jgi:hypothetical protein
MRTGYDVLDGETVRDVSVLDQTWAWTAGAIVSTADDLARFLPSASRRSAPASGFARHDGDDRRDGRRCAARLRIRRGHLHPADAVRHAWGHNGSTPGYLSNVFNSRTGARQVVLLVNRGETSLSQRAERSMQRLLGAAYCGA